MAVDVPSSTLRVIDWPARQLIRSISPARPQAAEGAGIFFGRADERKRSGLTGSKRRRR